MPPPEVGHLASTVTYTASFRNETQDTEMVLGPTFEDEQPMLINFPPSATSLKISGTRLRTAGIEMGIYAYMTSGAHPLYSFPAMGSWEETLELVPYFIDGSSEKPTKSEIEDPCIAKGSIIGCENQSLGEAVDLVGIPYRLHYQSSRSLGYNGASTAAIDHTQHLAGWNLNVHHHYNVTDNVLYLGDGSIRNASSLGQVTASSDGGYLIAADDGRQVFKFDANGRHTSTLSALTGATVLTFGYNPAGLLIAVTDGDNQTTTFNRNAKGGLATIVSPYGVVTKISVNKAGYIGAITNPAGKSHKAKYDAKGLMTSFADPRGMMSTFTYDAQGRLVADKNAAGGKQTLLATSDDNSVTVNRSSALGRVTRYQQITSVDGSSERKITLPSGLITTWGKTAQLSENLASGSGLLINMTPTSDDRFGLSARIPETTTFTTPGGLSKTITSTRTNTLSDQANPLSLSQQTETIAINGKTFSSLFDASTHTLTETTPVGRSSVFTLDDVGRVTHELVPGLNPVDYSYDSRGHLSSLSVGAGSDIRTLQFGYDSFGYLQALTSPLAQTQSFTRDKAGRVKQQFLPDGNKLKFAYDAAGNLLKLTNPAGKTYGFGYDKTGRLSKTVLPAAKGAKNTQTFSYNLDGQLTSMSRLDRTKQTYAYDNSGRLNALSVPGKTWSYGYDSAHGYLNSITEPGGIQLSLSRDGKLLKELVWSGTVVGQVGFTYNNDFQLQTLTVNNANPISYQYDNDGFLSQAGALSILRNSQNRLRTGSILGGVRDSYSYNGFGEVSHYQADFNVTSLLSIDYTYDAHSRIIRITESVEGAPAKTYSYSYNAADQLVSVTEGVHTHTYSYDKNGNRLTFSSSAEPSANASGRYDAQDRLLSYGTRSYAYTMNGEIKSVLQNNQAFKFEYNPLGNLTAAVLPSGKRIEYWVDGNGMRVARKNDATHQIFLYQDNLKPIAELDGFSNVVSRFVYANHVNVPDYMIKAGNTYRILTDHLGSPRLIVNVADGTVMQRLDYDEFGNVLKDTTPGFQPFGFAGGLYDIETQLIHFGSREFDPKTGRWTSRDPVMFSGGSINTYANLNDPVNTVDPSGREGFWDNLGKRISDALQNKFKSFKAGPVTISTDTPKVAIGGSQEIAAGDVSLIEVSAEASIEVISSGGAEDDFLKGNVTIGAKQPFLSKIPIIGEFFCGKTEVEATVKINPELVERMNTNIKRADDAAQYERN